MWQEGENTRCSGGVPSAEHREGTWSQRKPCRGSYYLKKSRTEPGTEEEKIYSRQKEQNVENSKSSL